MSKVKELSIYGVAINKKYFRELALIRHHPEKAKYYKGWMTRYRKQAKSKRWNLKGTGRELKEMATEIMRKKAVPKERFTDIEKKEDVKKEIEKGECWIWKKEVKS